MSTDTEPAGKGSALWLLPEEPMFSLLADEISRLSQRFFTPLFGPHVTLVGGITAPEDEAVAESALVARLIKPFRIELGEVGYSEEYFRCLFINVIPDDSLIKAHRTAYEAFDPQDEAAYMPHLSLVYGKLPVTIKEELAAACSFLSGRTFEVCCLALYRVSGRPQEWKCMDRFELR